MKKFWKALGIAALAAAVPVRFKKDEATGKKTYQSLLISVDVGPGKDDTHTDIGINLGEGLLTNAIAGLVGKKEEHLFADDEPEAAVVEPVTIVEPVVDEPFSPAEEIKAEETEATEEDFDPEL